MFDFKKACEEAKLSLDNKTLFALVLGPSGAGKSTLCGTLGGKLLMVYGSGESHGPRAASTFGADIVPVCIDVADGKPLQPDEAAKRLMDIISDPMELKKQGFTGVILDGAPELEALYLQTNRFTAMCTTDKGKIDGFRKTESMSLLLREVVNKLKDCHALGIAVVMTCRLDVKSMEEDGSISEGAIKLMSYGVSENLAAQFDDILLVGSVTVNGKTGYALQFGESKLSRVSKDVDGKPKRFLNFSPRITGVREVERLIKADLKKVVELKSGAKVSTKPADK